MIRKSLIALAAVASLAGFAGSANATTIHLGFNGYYKPVTYNCFWKVKTIKVVKYDYYGHPFVTWKKIRVKVCPHYGY
jgi:hypothetical protein